MKYLIYTISAFLKHYRKAGIIHKYILAKRFIDQELPIILEQMEEEEKHAGAVEGNNREPDDPRT